MLLAIDIGNTSITFGLFRRSGLLAAKFAARGGSYVNIKPIKVFKIDTASENKLLRLKLKNALRRYKEEIHSIIICSVVPEKTIILQQALRHLLDIKAEVIGKDIKVPIKNLYKKPEQVGQDRLVAAYACKKLYGAPAVIIDFGTAITFDYVTKKGEYAGGIITPGIEISLEALYERCALLPNVKMKTPKAFLAKGTKESIRSGTAYGLSCMCDGLIRIFKKKYGKNLKVVATGGYASFFKKRCKSIDIVDENLMLKGINFIYIKNFS